MADEFVYFHDVKYYETDQMRIVHHSNYIRWMEEARCAWLSDVGFGLETFEAAGVVSPVVSLSVKYLKPAVFPERVKVIVKLILATGVRMKISYKMISGGKEVFEGESEHCFTRIEGGIVNIKRDFPEFYNILRSNLEAGEN
ncbi:MAG: acyl-CoA thioesterase [Clostridiales bacterium]|nr:acyl-CoA thioesterase [Clostridiales bacterium]